MYRRNFLNYSIFGFIAAGANNLKNLLSPVNQEKGELPKIKEYRILGRTGFKVSDIASGAPYNLGTLNAMLDAGVNYIDTSAGYINGGSERVVGEAIKERDRSSLFITTKAAFRIPNYRGVSGPGTKREEYLNKVYKSLERLQTDYIDCLMIPNAENVSELLYEEFHAAAEQLKKEDRVRFIGVAHHGTQQWFYRPEQTMETVLLTAVKDGRFDVILLAHNFLKQDMSEKILDVCYKQNIGITLMKTNPIRGYFGLKNWIAEQDKERTASEEWLNRGRIKLSRLEEKFKSAQSFLQELNLKDPDEIGRAAVRFVLSNPRVNTVCVSYLNYNQVKEFLELSGSRLSTRDKQILAAYANSVGNFYCRHACGLCERQCPHGVPVNTIMRYDHYFEAQGREKYAMQKYSNLRTAKADLCQICVGLCEAACPYGVPVQGLLMLAHRNLTMV